MGEHFPRVLRGARVIGANAKTGGTNNFPQPERFVQKWPTGAWDQFADKRNCDPAVYGSKSHGLLFP